MPIYTYDCLGCGVIVDVLSSYADRDEKWRHCDAGSECQGLLNRHKVTLPTRGAPSFQPGAVMADGSVVKGHFGKTARAKGGWYRP